MTVKEVFELRKQGKIEEAYEAIRPMYAAHKGRYTTLCMFWTAADVFKLRLDQGRVEEATQILQALKRMLPRVDEVTKQLDKERSTATSQNSPTKPESKLPWEREENKQSDTQNKAAAFIASASRRLATALKSELKKKEKDSIYSSDSIDSCSKEEGFSSDFERSDPQEKDIRSIRDISLTEKKENIRETKEVPVVGDATVNCQLSTVNSEDLSGHLTVSLDEGIIRPIDGINVPQRVVLACITSHPGYSVPQISESTGIPAKSIERHVSFLIDRQLIEHRGSKKTGGYYIMN